MGDVRCRFESNFHLWNVLTAGNGYGDNSIDLMDLEQLEEPKASCESFINRKGSEENESFTLMSVLGCSSSIQSSTSIGSEVARQHNQWCHALYLSAFSNDNNDRLRIVNSYVDWLSKNATDDDQILLTFYELLLNRVPSFLNNPESIRGTGWRKHAAIILGLSKRMELDVFHSVIPLFVRQLESESNYLACQIIELLYQGRFCDYNNKHCNQQESTSTGLQLLGISDSCFVECRDFFDLFNLAYSRSKEDNGLFFSDLLDSIQISEIYEFICNTVIKSLLPFKLLIAHAFYEIGQYENAWRYCEYFLKNCVISKNIDNYMMCFTLNLAYCLKDEVFELKQAESFPTWLKYVESHILSNNVLQKS